MPRTSLPLGSTCLASTHCFNKLPARSKSGAHLTFATTSKQDAAEVFPEASRRAGVRLQNLVSGIGNGEDEYLNNVIQEQPAMHRTLLAASAGGIVVLCCTGLCWLCGNDPAGGARLSTETLGALCFGGVCAIPLLILKRLLWNDAVVSLSPVLKEMTSRRAEEINSLIIGLSAPQQAAVIVSDAVTLLAIMFVALVGCMNSSLTTYSHIIEDSTGLAIPEKLPYFVALGISACLYGLGQQATTSITHDEASVVVDAIENADRYYRVTAANEDKIGNPQTNTIAFRTVAIDWLRHNKKAAVLSGVLGCFDIVFLGMLWYTTGDLAAAAGAAILVSAVDYTSASQYAKVRQKLR